MSADPPRVWIARRACPVPPGGFHNVDTVILVCEDGSEDEALKLAPVFQLFRRPNAVLVGRITIHTLKHLGASVQHVVALPATAESQLGGTLWTEWARTWKKGARPWRTLRLDLTYTPSETRWVRHELDNLRQLRIADKILPEVK